MIRVQMIPIHGRPTPPQPDTRGMKRATLLSACWRGDIPAEVLDDRADRERLISDLWLAGWTDTEMAAHTKWSTYTVARIRARIGLGPHVLRTETREAS